MAARPRNRTASLVARQTILNARLLAGFKASGSVAYGPIRLARGPLTPVARAISAV